MCWCQKKVHFKLWRIFLIYFSIQSFSGASELNEKLKRSRRAANAKKCCLLSGAAKRIRIRLVIRVLVSDLSRCECLNVRWRVCVCVCVYACDCVLALWYLTLIWFLFSCRVPFFFCFELLPLPGTKRCRQRPCCGWYPHTSTLPSGRRPGHT